jgi:hypothetical protein
MRTTLDIDDDVLQAAKELARRKQRTAGQVISELVRRALTTTSPQDDSEDILGFRPFPSRGDVVTNELIDRLRDESVY